MNTSTLSFTMPGSMETTVIILAGDFIVLHNTSRLCSTKTITGAGIALEELCAAHNLQWFNQHVFQPIGCSKPLDLVVLDFSTPASTSVHHPLGRYDHATAIAGFVPAATHDRNRRSSGSSGTIRLPL